MPSRREKEEQRDANSRRAVGQLIEGLRRTTTVQEAAQLVLRGPKSREPGGQAYSALAFLLRFWSMPDGAKGPLRDAMTEFMGRLGDSGKIPTDEDLAEMNRLMDRA